jgi:large subunit ribosomal protein L15
MVKLNELKSSEGSHRRQRRIGRGQGSGRGSTAGKGNNGHKARSGSGTKPYFEGGQTPHTRRMPKRGFHNPFRVNYQIINLRDIAAFDAGGKEINAEVLYAAGLIRDAIRPLKVLGIGEVTKPLVIRASAFSKSAKEKIEKAKGKAEVKASV